MNLLSIRGSSVSVIKDGETVPYWFPLESTLITPNPKRDGLEFRLNDVRVICKYTNSGTVADTPFVSMAAFIAQMNTWQNTVGSGGGGSDGTGVDIEGGVAIDATARELVDAEGNNMGVQVSTDDGWNFEDELLKMADSIVATRDWVDDLLDNYSGSILFQTLGGIDTVGGGGTLYVGNTNADIVTIGRAGATVNILGTVLNWQATNSTINDALFTINKGGGAGTAVGTGFEVEENSIITGYFKTSGTRDGWSLKAPSWSSFYTFTGAPSAERTITFQNASGTVAFTSDVPSLSTYLKLTAVMSGTTLNLTDAAATASQVWMSTTKFLLGASTGITNNFAVPNYQVLTTTAYDGFSVMNYSANTVVFAIGVGTNAYTWGLAIHCNPSNTTTWLMYNRRSNSFFGAGNENGYSRWGKNVDSTGDITAAWFAIRGDTSLTALYIDNTTGAISTTISCALVRFDSTTKCLVLTRQTTTQREAMTTTSQPGALTYDITTDALHVTKNDGSWVQIVTV